MKRYHGGEAVRSGFYWNPARWEILPFGQKGGVLPGTEAIRYVKIPVVLLMVLGPFLGGVYMMFLPFIGFAMLFSVIGMKAVALWRGVVMPRLAVGRN